MKRLIWSLVFALSVPAGAAPSLVAPADAPVEGQPTVLTLRDGSQPASGLAVTAVYRENAHAALRHEQAVGTTSGEGTVEWTPESAGVVVLQWEGGSSSISVVYDGTPIGGILIALFAGLALLGGSVLFFLQMLRQDDSEMVSEIEQIGEPPST